MLLVLAIAIVGLGVWAWEPVYWWVTTKRVPVPESWFDEEDFDGHPAGFFTRGRVWEFLRREHPYVPALTKNGGRRWLRSLWFRS